MAGEQYEIYESGTAAALAEAQLALLDSKADKTGTYSTLTAGGTTPNSVTDAMLAQTGGVLSRLDNIVERYSSLESYLYKKDTYINNSGVDTALSGYDTYKIPVTENDLLHIKWSGSFWNALNPNYALKIEKSDHTYVNLSMFQNDTWFYIANSFNEGVFLFPEGYDYFVITAYAASLDNVSVYVNEPSTVLSGNSVHIKQTACTIDNSTAFKSKFYFHNSQSIQTLGGDAYAYWFPVKAGDKVRFSSRPLSYYATFHPFSTGTTVNITTGSYTAAEAGIICEFPEDTTPEVTPNATLIAADSIKVDVSNVIDTTTFKGLTWVSFGDSITYRNSWQPFVVDTLGMTHVNCGIGSTPLSGNSENAFWQAVRLNAVKAANPNIVTILGGANDITQNPYIGTESNLSDKDTSTFIGAYSYIIDNLLTWKPSLRIFILSTTWAHDDGASVSQTLTYGQFAEACKTVAEYYKLPFVDLYNNSGFNAYTMGALPNNIYSSDSIHPNDAGGRVIASQVIAKMQEVMRIH